MSAPPSSARTQLTAPTPPQPSLPHRQILFPQEIYDHLSAHIIGQEKPKKSVSVGLYKHARRLELSQKGGVLPQKDNILLVGPTGTGKTLLATTLAKILDVPFAACDATTLTETGYVGDDVETALGQLYAAAESDVARAQRGVIFIDEIDKIARRPTRTNRDISGEGAQRGLLNMLGGGIVRFDPRHRNKQPAELVAIDTAHILFICAGAFAGLTKIIQDRLDGRDVMEGEASFASDAQPGVDGLLQLVTGQDLIVYGLLPEFVARFTTIAVFSPLDRDSLSGIARHPEHGIVAEYRSYFAADGIELEFDDSAIAAIVDKSLSEGSGARALRAITAASLENAMFDVSGRGGVCRCVIHRGVIERGELPFLLAEGGDRIDPAADTRARRAGTTRGGGKRRSRRG